MYTMLYFLFSCVTEDVAACHDACEVVYVDCIDYVSRFYDEPGDEAGCRHECALSPYADVWAESVMRNVEIGGDYCQAFGPSVGLLSPCPLGPEWLGDEDWTCE